jgi:DNA-binding phage protein|tara:strand:- start:495 stop:644 length:150 start_codon:yes stop_codon:yes gene_type:complete
MIIKNKTMTNFVKTILSSNPKFKNDFVETILEEKRKELIKRRKNVVQKK